MTVGRGDEKFRRTPPQLLPPRPANPYIRDSIEVDDGGWHLCPQGRTLDTWSELFAVTSELESARAVKRIVEELRLNIYARLDRHPEAVYSVAELEALLDEQLVGTVLDYPVRTRSKLAKQLVCRALGYEAPESFRKVQPRFPAQDLDVFVQQSNNVQVWNEEVSATRRYALVRLDNAHVVTGVRVIEGTELAALDSTGTLTSKYQASRLAGRTGSTLVSASDTPDFQAVMAPRDDLNRETLRRISPVASPESGSVLSIAAVFDRVLTLIGRELPYSPSERLRGELLHRAVCEVLGLGSYADSGRFPDIVSQALEVKLQTARTVDLGLIVPDSREPATSLSPLLVHSDTRYLVVYAERRGDVVVPTEAILSTGADFFEEFQLFGGLVQNRKRQIRLPVDFFDSE